MRRTICCFFLLSVSPVVCQEPLTLRQALQAARMELWEDAGHSLAFAEAGVVSAGERPNPKLNLQTLNIAQSTDFQDHTAWNSPANRQIWWQLTKSFQLPPQRKLQLETANEEVDIARKTLEEQERLLYREVALEWLETWTISKHMHLWQTARAQLDSLAAAAQRQFMEQRISESDLVRIRLAAVNASLKLYKYRQELATASARLQTLLHSSGKVQVDTNDHTLFQWNAEASVLAEHSESRTDILLLRTELDHAGSELHLQRSLAWPQPELGVIYNPQNGVPYVGFYGTVEIPVFSRNQGEIRRSEAELRQAGEELSAAQEQAKTEIAAAKEDYQASKAAFTELQQLVTDSELLFRDIELSGAEGKVALADVFASCSSRTEMLDLYYDQAQLFGESQVRLLFVSGLIGRLAE